MDERIDRGVWEEGTVERGRRDNKGTGWRRRRSVCRVFPHTSMHPHSGLLATLTHVVLLRIQYIHTAEACWECASLAPYLRLGSSY